MKLRKDVAERLENAMPDGMRRIDLARALGVSAPYVTNVLKGNENLTIEQVARFAEAMDCEVHIYLTRKPKTKARKDKK